jgi:hypothetical protein
MSEIKFKTLVEIQKYYFPEQYEEEKRKEAMKSPGEFGKFVIDEILKEFRKILVITGDKNEKNNRSI